MVAKILLLIISMFFEYWQALPLIRNNKVIIHMFTGTKGHHMSQFEPRKFGFLSPFYIGANWLHPNFESSPHSQNQI